MHSSLELFCDTLIIGSGASGLALALRLATNQKIIILSKERSISECSTFYAQGGVAAVFDTADSISSHVEDTIQVGDGIVDKHIAEFVISNSHRCIEWLVDQGVTFDKKAQSDDNGSYLLTMEGGHSHRRILHVADSTGKAIETILVNKVLKHPNIKFLDRFAIDLIVSDKIGLPGPNRVLGAWVWNNNKNHIELCKAKVVVLATGGASKVYQYTTNPNVTSGDGISMAWRAGCRVSNLEFNQFHPTTLFHPEANNFLLTEALRGEGAWLIRPDGSRFMQDFDQQAELAPRDVITRVIDYEMRRLCVDCMYLDISHKPDNFVRQRFPMIYKTLLKVGMDLTQEAIPIVPAAHYTCGGVIVDKYGRTDIDRLYAIGEVSCTGLHGANRIASNSLLECLVYSWSASEDINNHIASMRHYIGNIPPWNQNRNKQVDQSFPIQLYWEELRAFMWNYVGITRTSKRLEKALHRVHFLLQEIEEHFVHFRISRKILELRNLVKIAELITYCAIMRKESRGSHYTLDYPKKLGYSKPSILSPSNSIQLTDMLD